MSPTPSNCTTDKLYGLFGVGQRQLVVNAASKEKELLTPGCLQDLLYFFDNLSIIFTG